MAWDIADAVYTSAFSVSAQDAVPFGVTFSPDGTKMFVLGGDNDSVYRYDLSTAWDITSATYVSTKSVSAQDGTPLGFGLSPDGTKMFMVGVDTDSVYRYDLSTAWDIVSATYVSLKDVSAQETVPRGLTFSPDGTEMFVVGDTNDSVHRYSLSTAWDLTTASYVSAKSVSAQDGSPYGVTFSGDGTKMFIAGKVNKYIYRYNLTTAWDITTASYTSSKNVYAQEASLYDVAFSPDGDKMFIIGYGSDSVYRYDMAAAAAPVVEGTPTAASSASDAEATAGSLTVASALASVASSTLAAVVAATLVISGTPADATSATDAAPTSEDFSTAAPPERTHTIPAESRLTTIPAESRTTGALP